jgi:hypothetical protein
MGSDEALGCWSFILPLGREVLVGLSPLFILSSETLFSLGYNDRSETLFLKQNKKPQRNRSSSGALSV